MKITKLIGELLRTNSGISSKAFFLVAVTLIGCLLLLVCGFVLAFEVIKTGTIHTDLHGLAAFVGAIAGLFATAGATKAFGERNEKNINNKDDEKEK
jgi:hypothetical protein